MEIAPERIGYFIDFRNNCWQRYKDYKDIKDKILFFIGTLFVTALIGTSFLILQSPNLSINPFVYLVQYILVQILFLLLFLYYQYNRLASEMYLLEAACCERFLNKVIFLIPYTELKELYFYSDQWQFQGRKFKHFANWLLGIAYLIFSLSPLIFKFELIKLDGKALAFNWAFAVPFILFVIALILLDRMYSMNF